jgi:hypothetical protein
MTGDVGQPNILVPLFDHTLLIQLVTGTRDKTIGWLTL